MQAMLKGVAWVMRWGVAGLAFGFCAWWGAGVARAISVIMLVSQEITR